MFPTLKCCEKYVISFGFDLFLLSLYGFTWGGLDWVLGRIYLLEGWSGLGTGCLGKCSKGMWVWHLETWFSGWIIISDHFRGYFQP